MREGWTSGGTCRSRDKAERLSGEGIAAVVFDGERPSKTVRRALPGTTHLLATVPPRAGDPVLLHHRDDIAAVAPGIAWAGYLSTTSVYGDRSGAWIDESTTPSPTEPRGRLRLEAEQAWAALPLPLHIFRVAGIYGPGRNPLLQVLDGSARRIVRPGQVFNRIHEEDLVAVLAASIARPRPGAVYDVADGEPASQAAPFEEAARLLGLPPPPEVPFEQATLSPMGRSFWAENKRIRARLIRDELGVRLLYPSFREGIAREARRLAGAG